MAITVQAGRRFEVGGVEYMPQFNPLNGGFRLLGRKAKGRDKYGRPKYLGVFNSGWITREELEKLLAKLRG